MMRIPDVGSQYLMGFVDSRGSYDGGKTYKVTLPKGIPARAFWSFTVDDNQTRSTPTRRSVSPVPAARVIHRPRPSQRRRLDDDLFRPDAAARRGARQLDPNHAGQGMVHDPAPLQPARIVLRQELATDRDRTGLMSWAS